MCIICTQYQMYRDQQEAYRMLRRERKIGELQISKDHLDELERYLLEDEVSSLEDKIKKHEENQDGKN